MNTKDYIARYHNESEKKFRFPDIGKGFIPQGISYDAKKECFLVTGYKITGGASPIYVIDAKTNLLKKTIYMKHPNGKRFRGHAGGLSVYNDKLYVAGSTKSCMYVYELESIYEAADKSFLSYSTVLSLKTENDHFRVSFTSTDDQLLYAGEFYRPNILFRTADSHKIKVKNGTTYGGFLFGFTIENNIAVPRKVFSVCNNVQGAAFLNGKVYLSVSHGYHPAQINTYDLSNVEQSGTVQVLGKDIPLYVLSDDVMEKSTIIAPMSEEMVIVENYLYLVTEYASNLYLLGKFREADYLYATDIQRIN